MPPEDATNIRKDCEQRARALQRQQWEKRIERNLAKRGVFWGEDGDPNPIDLPQDYLSWRPTVSEYGSLHPEKKIPSNLPVEVRYAIETMRANKLARGPQQYYSTETLPRLYGAQRQKIIADVAAAWGVPPRTVRSIWESKPAV